LIEERGGFLKAIGLNSPGGQLNRECNTIKLSADARDDLCVSIPKVQASAARRRTLHEKLDRGICLNGRRG